MIPFDSIAFGISAFTFFAALFGLRLVLQGQTRSDRRASELMNAVTHLRLSSETLRAQVTRLLELQQPILFEPESKPAAEPEKLPENLPGKAEKDKEFEIRSKPLPGDTRCPYCHSETSLGHDIAICVLCSTRHHVSCHKEHGKCAVNGCESSAVVKGPVDELREAGILTEA